jgi:tagatose kinase
MLLIPGEPIVILPRDPGLAPQASGAPAIAAWAAASLGVRTTFLGGVGADDAGDLMRATLAAVVADPSAIVTKAGLPTATARVDYDPDGSRSFEFHVAGSAATALDLSDLGRRPEQATWLHVSGSALLFGGTTTATVVEAVRRGRAAGATVSVDPNLRAELDDPAGLAMVRQLCERADVLFPSEGELEALGLDEDHLVGTGTAVCRTMAADGARLRAGRLDLTIPAVAPAEQVVDPDGAGDTFAGAVIAARMRGSTWGDAIRAASQVVARAITVAGPMTMTLRPADLVLSTAAGE